MTPKALPPVVLHFAQTAQRQFVTQTRSPFPPEGRGRVPVRVQSVRGLGVKFNCEEPAAPRMMNPQHAASGGRMPHDVRSWWTSPLPCPEDVFGLRFDLKKGVTPHMQADFVMQGLNGEYTVIDWRPVLEGTVLTDGDRIEPPGPCSGFGTLTIYHGRLSAEGYSQREFHAQEFVRLNPRYRRYPEDGKPVVNCLTFVQSELNWLLRHGHLAAKNPRGLEALQLQQMHSVSLDLVNYRLLDAGLHSPGFDVFDDDEVHLMHAKGVVVSPWLCREGFEPFREHRHLWFSKAQLAAGLAGVPAQPVPIADAAGTPAPRTGEQSGHSGTTGLQVRATVTMAPCTRASS